MKRTALIFTLLLAVGIIVCGLRDPRFSRQIETGKRVENIPHQNDLHSPSAIVPIRVVKASVKESAIPPGNVIAASKEHSAVTEPIFAQFLDWSGQFVQADAAGRAALESRGIALAGERRAAMAGMIQTNPERALELAVPFYLRAELPPGIKSLLEERVSGRGNIEVWAALPDPDSERPVARHAQLADLNGRILQAFTYGRRAQAQSRENVSMHGIAVDKFFAMHEDPVRVLEPDEAAQVASRIKAIRTEEEICAVSDLPSDSFGEETIVEANGEIIFLCGTTHIDDLNQRLTGAAGDFSLQSTWSEGEKKVLYIRIEYPNLTGSPVSEATLTTMNADASDFFDKTSFGKTMFRSVGLTSTNSRITPLYMMPQNHGAYGTGFTGGWAIHADARAAATADGYSLSSFNFIVVCSRNLSAVLNGASFASVGSPGRTFLNGDFYQGILTHEVGHNYGVWHAGAWDPSTTNPIGSGSHVEYGDVFDGMGDPKSGNRYQFNVSHKRRLDWITATEVKTVASSANNGVTRLYAHDNSNSLGSGRLLALRVDRSSGNNYWIEYRTRFTDNSWMMNGAGIRLRLSPNVGDAETHLLDMNPSTSTMDDAPLVIGRTHSDAPDNIHITPIDKGSETINGIAVGWLDVIVMRGLGATNSPPTLPAIDGLTNGVVNQKITFTANDTDPNGDALAYYWDFHNGTSYNTDFQSSNTQSIVKSWSSTNTYKVRCRVTDMRGGTASKEVTVAIGTTPPAPAITSQPQSQTNNVGATVAFSVTATSTSLNYQWRFGGGNLAGATGSILTRTNIQLSDQGNYSVVVSNAGGVATSSNASLTVVVPPSPNQSPLLAPLNNRTIHAGATVTFTNFAHDPDAGDVLVFSLDAGAPDGATVHPQNGMFSWNTTDAAANTVNPITVRVTDDGDPPLSGTASFTITVRGKPSLGNVSISGGAFNLSWSAIPDTTYRVEYKTDLNQAGWLWLDTVISSGETASFSDAAALEAERYYRVVAVP